MPMFVPPTSYRAAAVTQIGRLELIRVPWRNPQQGEVVLKVEACAVCRSDEMAVEQIIPSSLPRIPGHEIVGRIVDVHVSEPFWKVGQRVGAGWHGSHCFVCDQCKGGDFNTCENEAVNGVTVDGGYAEYATLRSEVLIRIPEDMDAEEVAPLMCSGVTAYNSMRNMGIKPGQIVAIQGIGGIGHLALQYSRAMGFKTVALSTSDHKRDLAFQLGAHEYLDGSKVDQAEELRKMGGAKLIVASAPNQDLMRKLIPGLAAGGTFLILAVAPEELSIPTLPIIVRRLSIRGWPVGSAKDTEECVTFTKMTNTVCHTQKYPLANVLEAYESVLSGAAKFKAVLIP